MKKKRGPLSGKKKPKAQTWPDVRVMSAGKVETVSALRAARWLEAGLVQLPADLTAEEGRAVLDAKTWRDDQVVKRLDRDGLLVGSPNCAGSVPVEGSLWGVRRWLTWLR